MNALPGRLPLALPLLHIILFLTTELFGDKIASGGNPLFCVDLPVSLPLVASDSPSRVIVVGIVATTWWYFIGKIASEAWKGKVTRMISAAAALLLFLLGAAASFAMISELRLISQESNFGNKDFVVYTLAVVLLFGEFVCAGYAMASGFRPVRGAN
ncbi:MAG: hypothetical protein WA437_16255 [Candidatus Sulfotelmatobacter sp.]